ncbi:hypothetical protein OsI_01549 [Oryza sativa Indica Group]|uniref:Uncharacterized protein n=1 Tax=Oryza sativa subsp. indica TaxID=39946 RepID=B8A6Q0_ORYSI|nr:hypothetical protein OsI_01549 [Oryza sativa Indica Group]
MEGGGAGVEGVKETTWSARGWEVDGGRIHDHRGRTHPNLLSGSSIVMTTTARRRMATLLATVRMGGNNFDNDRVLGEWRLLVMTETLSHARVGRLQVKGLVLFGPLVTTLLGTVTLLGALSWCLSSLWLNPQVKATPWFLGRATGRHWHCNL